MFSAPTSRPSLPTTSPRRGPPSHAPVTAALAWLSSTCLFHRSSSPVAFASSSSNFFFFFSFPDLVSSEVARCQDLPPRSVAASEARSLAVGSPPAALTLAGGLGNTLHCVECMAPLSEQRHHSCLPLGGRPRSWAPGCCSGGPLCAGMHHRRLGTGGKGQV